MSSDRGVFSGVSIVPIRPLSETLSVSGQIDPQDMAELAAAGFRSVICNRPDDEDPGQPSFASISAAAQAAGLVAVHQPVRPGGVTAVDAEVFGRHYDGLPKPVLAYCRSGARCTSLWSMSRGG
jgi:sulfide:quinone oxidoreductase